MSELPLDVRKEVCFVGIGTSAVNYYRCILPAMTLGCDWVGVTGKPPKLEWRTGLVKNEQGMNESKMPDLTKYRVVVLQQPAGPEWITTIKALQDRGVIVIYEVDDYLHGIKFLKDHDFRDYYKNDYLAMAEKAMKTCDAVIASTEWIRGNYLSFNKRAYLCRNGIDLARYNLEKVERKTVNIGWAGATGHQNAVIPWFQQAASIMRLRENTTFVSIGQPFADGFAQHFGTERALSVPFAAIEQYPAAMTMLDVALAPAGEGGWWRGKSDLRWLEAGALGIPIIADPNVYPEIEHGVTGFHTGVPEETAEYLLALVDNAELRLKMGEAAKKVVRETRSIDVMAKQWADVFHDLVDDKPSTAVAGSC